MWEELRELAHVADQNTTAVTTLRRYEIYARTPPHDDLLLMWLIWAVVAGFVGVFCVVVIAGVLSSRATRNNTFNVILVFLIVPDAFFSLNCSLTCALNRVAGEYVSHAMCEWQSWYVIFDFTANAWLNAVVGRLCRNIVVESHRGRRFSPPTMRNAAKQIVAVYVYSACVAALTLLNDVGLPIRASPALGMACMPVEYSVPSTIFFWIVCVPAIMLVPLVYTMWVCYDVVVRRGILPHRGRSRFLFLFFMRLAAVFVFMWIPTIVIMFGIGTPNFWLGWSGGTWSHLQGFVSTLFILTKPDVYRATTSLLCCRSYVPKSRLSRIRAGMTGLRSSMRGVVTATSFGRSTTCKNHSNHDNDNNKDNHHHNDSASGSATTDVLDHCGAEEKTNDEDNDNDNDNDNEAHKHEHDEEEADSRGEVGDVIFCVEELGLQLERISEEAKLSGFSECLE